MAGLNDYPVRSVVEFIRELNSRCWDRGGGLYEEVTRPLPDEEAWLFWAAKKWLEVVQTISSRKEANGAFTVEELLLFLDEKLRAMKAQPKGEKLLGLSQVEMRMLMDIEIHLDRLAMAKEADANPKVVKFRGKKR